MKHEFFLLMLNLILLCTIKICTDQRSAMNRFFAILYMRESTVLEFNTTDSFVHTTTLIYVYRLQWVWVQRWHQTHNIQNMFDSYACLLIQIHKFRKILIILINDPEWFETFIKISSLSCCCIYKKKKRRKKNPKTTNKASTKYAYHTYFVILENVE